MKTFIWVCWRKGQLILQFIIWNMPTCVVFWLCLDKYREDKIYHFLSLPVVLQCLAWWSGARIQSAISVAVWKNCLMWKSHSISRKCGSANSKTFPIRPFCLRLATFWIHDLGHLCNYCLNSYGALDIFLFLIPPPPPKKFLIINKGFFLIMFLWPFIQVCAVTYSCLWMYRYGF